MGEAKRVLYALTGPTYGGDRPAFLIDGTSGEVIYHHVSSTKSWAFLDVTRSFGRDRELATKYPDGFEVVEAALWDEVPEEAREANAKRYPQEEGTADG